MIKNILFDLDDTLFDFHKAEALAVSKMLEKMNIEPTNDIVKRYSEINAGQWVLLEEGRLTREEVLTGRFSILFEELGVKRSGEQAMEIYEGLLAVGHYFIPGAEELLENLYTKYRLYLVSNGSAAVQRSRLESSGIEKYFQGIFISEKVGYDKPDVRFFQYCFGHIEDFLKEETIIVGDSLTSDMRGGNNAEIKTCWFNPRGKERHADIPVDYEIGRLSELLEVLEENF